MRTTVLSVLFAFLCGGEATGQMPPDASAEKTERAAQSYEAAKNELTKFAFYFESDRQSELMLHPTPVFRATNPLRGEVYSNWFVWTRHGRPEVVASISKWYSPRPYLGLAATSLSSVKLVGTREGQEIWRPRSPGVQLRPVQGATSPEETPAVRLAQMRALAREFTAEFRREASIPEGGMLRLLNQPLFRYAGTGSDLKDGALFAFANGSAPQLLLMIEARQDATGIRWEYALAPMNSTEFHVWHKGREVWSLPQVAPPWRNSQNPTNVYTVFPDLTDKGRTQQLVNRLSSEIE
jgi:hypothetical protein